MTVIGRSLVLPGRAFNGCKQPFPTHLLPSNITLFLPYEWNSGGRCFCEGTVGGDMPTYLIIPHPPPGGLPLNELWLNRQMVVTL